MAYGGLSTIKCQQHVADVAYPPHLEQQEKRVTTDIKHVLTSGWYEAVTAAVESKEATDDENIQPQLVG